MEKKTYDDIECPICYEVNVEPVKLPCNHYLCFSSWFRIRLAYIMLIIDTQ